MARLSRLPLGLALALPAGPALAHHPMGGAMPETLLQGLLSGLGHPVIGPDHLAFLLAAALVAAVCGRAAAWPLLFVGASLASVAGFAFGIVLPGAEWLVAATVIAMGALLIARRALATPVWAALLLVAGIAHGQAYAEAITGAEATPILGYLLGLAAVQGAIVLGAGVALRSRPALTRLAVTRLAGAAVAVLGLAGMAGMALAGALAGG